MSEYQYYEWQTIDRPLSPKFPYRRNPGVLTKRLHYGGVFRVGAPGIEPGTSCTPCKRASRTAPRPVNLSQGSFPRGQGAIIAAINESGNQSR